VRRIAHDDFLGGEWELPGGVDDGETFEQGAIRELFEETGLKVDQILGTFEGFDYKTPKKPKVRQLNFRVTVGPGSITLEPNEHDGYRFGLLKMKCLALKRTR
jgi:8-oxo-dGTP diphosphatase